MAQNEHGKYSWHLARKLSYLIGPRFMCGNRQHNRWRCFGISFLCSLSSIRNISLLKWCAFYAFDAVFLGQGSQIIYVIDLKIYTLWSFPYFISLERKKNWVSSKNFVKSFYANKNWIYSHWINFLTLKNQLKISKTN